MTEFCHSLWILFTKCWNLLCPKITFKGFGYEKQKREREREKYTMYKSRPIYIPNSEDTNGSLHYPFPPLNPLWQWIVGYFCFLLSSWAVCVYRENGLTEICSSSFFFAFKHWGFCFVLVKFTDAWSKGVN